MRARKRGSRESEQNEGGAVQRKSLPCEGLARKWDGDAKTIRQGRI